MFITKCDNLFITKCKYSLIVKCDDCYKLRNELQIAIDDGYYDKL